MNKLVKRKQILETAVALLLVCVAFLMSYKNEFRPFAYAGLTLFIALMVFVFTERIALRKWRPVIAKSTACIISFLLLILAKDVYLVANEGVGVKRLVYPLFGVLFVASFFVLSEVSKFSFFRTFAYVLFIVGCVVGSIEILGIKLPILPNYIAGFMAPLAALKAYHFKMKASHIVPIILCLFFSIYFGARGALLVMLLVFGFVTLLRIKKENLMRPAYYFLFMLIFLSQSYIAVDNSVFVNELLTYRPTIWNYYFNEALAAPWFGNGPVMEDTSTGAAIAYQAAVERGVGELYGPHSMYLRYFYESGGIGLIGILSIFFYLSRKPLCFEWVLMSSYSLSAFFSSGIIGFPSLYSIILLLSIVMLLEKSKSTNVRRAQGDLFKVMT